MESNHLDKTPNDLERETALLEQLIRLAEERNFAELPPPGSGIPGDFIVNRTRERDKKWRARIVDYL